MGGPRPYGKSVYATWRTSRDLLSPDARFLLDLCAWLAPDPIPDWMLDHPVTRELSPGWLSLGQDLPNDAPLPNTPLDSDAIAALTRAGLATRLCLSPESDEPVPAFAIHRIVQDVTRLHQFVSIGTPEAMEWSAPATAWVAKLLASMIEETGLSPGRDALVPHAVAIVERMEKDLHRLTPTCSPTGHHHICGQICESLAEWARMRGKIYLHTAFRERALVHSLLLYGEEHPCTLSCRSNFGVALGLQGEGRAAELELCRVLEARTRVLGVEDPETLMTRYNLANALMIQGKRAQARHEHALVKGIRERILGPDHHDTLASRHNLALFAPDDADQSGVMQEAESVFLKLASLLGVQHPDTLGAWHNVSLTLQREGWLVEAEKSHRERMMIEEQVLGPDHPDYLKSRCNLAQLLLEQRLFELAEVEHRSVLEIRERTLGRDHIESVASLCGLLQALVKQGKFDDAKLEAENALEGFRSSFGCSHPVSDALLKLISLLANSGLNTNQEEQNEASA